MRVSKPSTIPSIMIFAEGLQIPARMMINTGAGRNLIKQNVVNPELPINVKKVLKLIDINNLKFYPMGQVQINILGYLTILNITPNEVSINEDGVLVSEIF